MTALIGTGHSIDWKNDGVKVSFRPQAAVLGIESDPFFQLVGTRFIMTSDKLRKSARLLDNDGMAGVVKKPKLRARYRIPKNCRALCWNDLVVNTVYDQRACHRRFGSVSIEPVIAFHSLSNHGSGHSGH